MDKEIDEEEIIGADLVEVGEGSEGEQQVEEHDNRWEDLVDMVESMGLSLVPTEKLNNQDLSISARKKGRVRELQNLKFNVKFKDSDFRRGIFNSK